MYERDPFKVFEHAGMQVRIEYDDSNCTSREWDNLGVMLFWHNRMSLGDDTETIERAGLTKADPDDFGGWQELLRGCGVDLERDVIIPVFAYEHGGITIRAGGYSPYWPDIQWDAGQLGFIVCPYERIRSEYSVRRVSKKMRERIAGYLTNEVETYDDDLVGNVYGYRVIDPETEDEESCWGFYPDHSLPYDRELEYLMGEAKGVAEGMAEEKLKNAGWVSI